MYTVLLLIITLLFILFDIILFRSIFYLPYQKANIMIRLECMDTIESLGKAKGKGNFKEIEMLQMKLMGELGQLKQSKCRKDRAVADAVLKNLKTLSRDTNNLHVSVDRDGEAMGGGEFYRKSRPEIQ